MNVERIHINIIETRDIMNLISDTIPLNIQFHMSLQNETENEIEDSLNDSSLTENPLNLINQTEIFETSVLAPNRENEIIFNELFDIDIHSLNLILLVEIFEINLFNENPILLGTLKFHIKESINSFIGLKDEIIGCYQLFSHQSEDGFNGDVKIGLSLQ